MFRIVFRSAGQIVQTQEGFTSRTEARATIKEMDSMIPFHWDWTIEEDK